MIFQSSDYLAFLLLVTVLYWWLSRLAQNVLLLVASYLFYGYVHPWYLLLIGTTTLVDYTCARFMERLDGPRRRWPLIVSLCTNFFILAVFKYFNFFGDNLATLLGLAGIEVPSITYQVLLPVGISFYTFQSASYVIDVYRGKLTARDNLLDYALFVSFFPQLVAGPIERAAHLLRQVESKRCLDWVTARSGVVLIVWGVFKKLVIADTLAVHANKAFALADSSFPILWGGALAFAFQIYADFSAYTDIARGSARLLGFNLMQNFHHPYAAQSPADFWKRWHVSLSTWFRDYVYIPLGGSRGTAWFITRNVMITFILSGLWHGASWNFVLWGTYHGALLVAWRWLDQVVPGWTRSPAPLSAVSRLVTMWILTLFGWILFREQDPDYLWKSFGLNPFAASAEDWSIGAFLGALSLLYSVPLWLHWAVEGPILQSPRWIRFETSWSGTVLQAFFLFVLILLTMCLKSNVGSAFIYFQF